MLILTCLTSLLSFKGGTDPIEKVYLHLDKPYYTVGDDIWFKAYVTDQDNKLSEISSELYVELINEKDVIVKQIKLPLSSGLTWGDLRLTDDLSGGNYRIRAYTQWMRSAGPDYFYDKTIKIGKFNATPVLKTANPNKKIILQTTPDLCSIQFFPESGNLIQGISSKVGIKVVNGHGLGEDVEGTLTDNNGNEVLKFHTSYLGMGNFILNPIAGRTYTARIKRKEGTTQESNLPTTLSSGYVLTVDNSDDQQIRAIASASVDLLSNSTGIKLVLQHNNTIDTTLSTTSGQAINSFLLPKKKLSSGIFNLILFSGSGIPLCERLIFIGNPDNEVNISLPALKQNYTKRENISFDLIAKNGNQPARGSFSISVTNTNTVEPDPDNESNILSSLLLSSNLKGYIEKPNYYFNTNSAQSREYLDNLLLIQGWSRFSWKNINNKPKKQVLNSSGQALQIKGKVTTLGNKALAKARVSLSSTNNGYFAMETVTDSNGRFSFDKLSFADSTKFIIHAFNVKHKNNVDLVIDTIPGQEVTKNKNTGDITVDVNRAIQDYITKTESYFDQLIKRGMRDPGINLREVSIKGKKVNPAKNSSNLNGPGNADFIMTGKDIDYTNNIYIALENLMAGVTIKDRVPYLINGTAAMLIVIDGQYVDPSFLDFVDIKEIVTIEVLKNSNFTGMYGNDGRNGVLIITTLSGRGANPGKKMNGVITLAPKGFYKIREFYSPQYTPSNQTPIEDKRSTIYWKPGLLTDGDGKASISFYSADEPGIYRIVIEGINEQGNLARSVHSCEVRE